MQLLANKTSSKIDRSKGSSEVYWVILVLFALLGVLVLFSSQSWSVWSDEVLLTDPAANLFLGNGFTSSAWYFQPKEEFWASNAPLHAGLLFFWLKIFGLNIVAVRSFNYVLIGLASLLIWASMYRTNIVSTARNRLIAVLAIVLSQGVSFSYLSGRYDCLAITLFSFLAFACTFNASWLRNLGLFVIAGLISAAGFHLLPYAVVMLFFLYLFVGKSFVEPAVWIVLGLTFGLFSVIAIYIYKDVFPTFIETVGGHSLSHVEVPEAAKETVGSKILFVVTNFFPILAFRLQELPRWYSQDVSFSLLSATAVLSLLGPKSSSGLRLRSPLCFALLVALTIPLVMGVFRNYPDYYTWMATIPLCVGVAAALPAKREAASKGAIALLVSALLVAACLVGLPKRLLPVVQHIQASRYGAVEAFVQEHIDPDEKVFSDFGPYYAIKKQVDFVLFPTYLDLISQDEKDQLTTLLLDSKQFHHNHRDIDLFGQLDGEWAETGETLTTPQYDLKIFRRINQVASID